MTLINVTFDQVSILGYLYSNFKFNLSLFELRKKGKLANAVSRCECYFRLNRRALETSYLQTRNSNEPDNI